MCVSCMSPSHVPAPVCARLPMPSREILIQRALTAFQASITQRRTTPARSGSVISLPLGAAFCASAKRDGQRESGS